MTGWPAGLVPSLDHPYSYSGDGLAVSRAIQRAIEGWVFDNPRSGYPFGSNFLDYPTSDFGSLLILKFLGMLGGSYYAAFNLFFLLSFPVVLISAFCVLQAIGLNKCFALSGALLFTFVPFHFQRLAHTFYLWYFAVPIFYYLAFLFFEKDRRPAEGPASRSFLLWCPAFLLLAPFGVYYAIFGLIVVFVAGLAGWLRHGQFRALLSPAITVLLVISGVLINVAPSLVHRATNGPNAEVAVISPADSERYGLKLIQLVYPRDNHRIDALAKLTRKYQEAPRPLVNENRMAALGVVGAVGLLVVGCVFLARLSGRPVDDRLSLLTIVVMTLFVFGTIGGIGAVFADIVSPSIRGWNRISIFISFGAIAAFFVSVQTLISRHFAQRANAAFMLVAAAVTAVGLYDQTVPACATCVAEVRKNFDLDREFIRKIENATPRGAAIYQLPYMPFPEVPPLFRLGTYDLVVGFLHSDALRWRYGGIKGRDGDLFYRALAKEPIEKQLAIVERLGFAGLYIDRRGFDDNANGMIERVTKVLGRPPALTRADGEVVFFKLEPQGALQLAGLTSAQIMNAVGFDKLGTRYAATRADGIDFTRADWPEFIRDVKGLSPSEPWGRWSDANLYPAARFEFFPELPRKFTLVLSARAFGPNANSDVVVRVGALEQKFRLGNDVSEVRVAFELGEESASVIEFFPPRPISPKKLGMNADRRKLGLGFVRLRIEER